MKTVIIGTIAQHLMHCRKLIIKLYFTLNKLMLERTDLIGKGHLLHKLVVTEPFQSAINQHRENLISPAVSAIILHKLVVTEPFQSAINQHRENLFSPAVSAIISHSKQKSRIQLESTTKVTISSLFYSGHSLQAAMCTCIYSYLMSQL